MIRELKSLRRDLPDIDTLRGVEALCIPDGNMLF